MTHEELQKILASADAASQAGNLAEAERHARHVLESSEIMACHESMERKDSSALAEPKPEYVEIYFRTLHTLAWILFRQGVLDEVRPMMERLAELSEYYQYPAFTAMAYQTLGAVFTEQALYELALRQYAQAKHIFERLDMKQNVARASGNIGSVYMRMSDYPTALEYLQDAAKILEELEAYSQVAIINGNIGNLYMSIGDNTHALEYMSRALGMMDTLGMKADAIRIRGNIGIIYKNLGDYELAMGYYTSALAGCEQTGMRVIAARTKGNIGTLYGLMSDHLGALEYILAAMSIHDELGLRSEAASFRLNAGKEYMHLGDYERSHEFLHTAVQALEELDAKATLPIGLCSLGELYAHPANTSRDEAKAEEYYRRAVAVATEMGSKHDLMNVHRSYAQLLERQHRWEEAFLQYKQFHTMERAVLSEEATKEARQLESRRKVEEAERDRQLKLARFQGQEKILHNILPAQIAERMLDGESRIADAHQQVSIFFSDIIGFTHLSQHISAGELVSLLNDICVEYDRIARRHGIEKIKTIGDAYMAVCGAPMPQENHAERAALFALDIAEFMKKYHTPTGEQITIRIGLHTGSAVAGVIGENKFAYDLWGDAVNTASRMESHGEAGKIHVSEDFIRALSVSSPASVSSFHLHKRGEMDIKGKGKMTTYFLERKSAP